MVILDTNVVSALMRPADNPPVVRWLDGLDPDTIWTTSVTILEVRFGLLLMDEGRRRTALVLRFEILLSRELEGRVAPFDRAAAEQAAYVSAARRAAGRRVESNDVQIAGIALSLSAALATRNIKDFSGLGLELIDPWAASP